MSKSDNSGGSMHCPNCGHEIRPGEHFCAGCGRPIGAAPKSSKNSDMMYGVLGAVIVILAGIAGYMLYDHYGKGDQAAVQVSSSSAAETSSLPKKEAEQKPAQPDIRRLYYAGKGQYLPLQKKSVSFGNVIFREGGNRHVLVYDANGKQLLDLYGPETTEQFKDSSDTYADKSVREIQIEGSNKHFYEVLMTTGAHAKLEGYWIVGEKNGEWISYVSLDNLKPFGFDKTKYYNLNVQMDADNKIVLNGYHMYVPPGAASYQGKKVDDFFVTIDWDENAGTFRMY